MKKSRSELEKYFEHCLVRYVKDKKTKQWLMEEAFTRYNIPFTRSQTILDMTGAVLEYSDAEIFWFLDCMSKSDKWKIKKEDYFTDIELDGYSKMRYAFPEVKFPLIIRMTKLAEDQWIGAISGAELVVWRGSIIRYNANIQRILRTAVVGGIVYQTPKVNPEDVEDIKNLLLNDQYIPTPITLNIDDTADFYYDEAESKMYIYSAEHLDLSDGYTRLVALSKAREINPSKSYPMALQIQYFSEDKANQFIYQQLQGSRMPKKEISSFNMADSANKIAKRINESNRCLFSGNIIRGGKIDFAVFTNMLRQCILNEVADEDAKKVVVTAPKEIINALNTIAENDPDIVTKKMSIAEVRILVYCCARYYQKDKDGVYETYKYMSEYPYTEEQKKTLSISREKRVESFLDSILEGSGNV